MTVSVSLCFTGTCCQSDCICVFVFYRYLSSVWVDNEERSVYGVGHPKGKKFSLVRVGKFVIKCV